MTINRSVTTKTSTSIKINQENLTKPFIHKPVNSNTAKTLSMKRPLLNIIMSLALLATMSFDTPEEKWIKLFNGKSLDGWTAKIVGHEAGKNFGNTFRVENGILSVRYDQYNGNFNNRFGGLYYNTQFNNFRLLAEYRFVGELTPGAPSWGYRDSGIQYHSQSPASMAVNQPFPVCLEYNLHGGNGKDERPVGEICANGMNVQINGKKNESYCTSPTIKRTFHGDQWVTLEIDVRDTVITHFVNGEEILRYTNPRYNAAHELGRTFIKNGDDRVRDGYISIQSNSHPIDFRRIEIRMY
jgi:hypothetical protein